MRHSYAQWHRRTRALASALQRLGLKKGDRVATLAWNHHAHLECYFGIPAAGGVMHTLNLRLSPDEIGWIAGDANDRFLIVDDVLLPLYRQFADRHAFERVIVFPFSGAPVTGEFADYEALLADADPDGFEYAAHDENDPIAMCYTSGTTGRPKGVVYSHRSTVLHTLVGCLPDHWGLRSDDVLMPVTPMFHANCWGVPYGAVMLGVKTVFPGPHLHPDDLLDLMQLEPPTLSLGVPTIWMTLIQAYERALAEQPGRWKLPQGMRSLVGGAAVPESLIRAYDRHGVQHRAGLGHDRDVAAGHRLVPARRAARCRRRRALSARRDGGRAGAAGRPARAHRRRHRRRVGRPHDGRDPGARPVHHGLVSTEVRTPTPARQVHRPTAGCAPATSRRWTSWASCASPTARRT